MKGIEMTFTRATMGLVVLACLSVANPSYSQEARPLGDRAARLQSVTSHFFVLVSAGRFEEATELFWFPPNFTPAERSKDAAGVAVTLRIITREFGVPEAPEPDDSAEGVYGVGGGGGDFEYWQKHPVSVDIRFRAHFTREGDGFVIFKFLEVGDSLRIRELNYGLPARRSGARDRIQQIMETLIKEKSDSPAPGQAKQPSESI